MKRTLFRIAYALGLKRLAHRISPSLYCMELGKIMAKNFEKGFKIALADVEGQAAFQQRLQEWLTEDHIEEKVRRKMTVKEAIYELNFALGEIYDQVFYDDKPYEFNEDGYEALDMAFEALKHGVNTEDLVARIKQSEPFNNPDCPQWVLNIIKGAQNDNSR